MSIYASVSVKHLDFGEGMMKALFEPVFLVAILIFCQSRLLFSQHVVKDCDVLADYFCYFAVFADS